MGKDVREVYSDLEMGDIRWAVASVCECTVTSGQQRKEITKTFSIVCEGVFLIIKLYFNLPYRCVPRIFCGDGADPEDI